MAAGLALYQPDWKLNNRVDPSIVYDPTPQLLRGHTFAISHIIELLSNSDGKQMRVVSCCVGKTIKIWDVYTGECLVTIALQARVTSIVELDDGTLLTTSSEKFLRRWDPNSGTCLATHFVSSEQFEVSRLFKMKRMKGMVGLVMLPTARGRWGRIWFKKVWKR